MLARVGYSGCKQPEMYQRHTQNGAIAQLGERLHGMQEVGGSIPPGSTIPHPIQFKKDQKPPYLRGFSVVRLCA